MFASVDAAIAHADKTLASERHAVAPTGERDPLVYDLDWDEDARLAEWRALVDETRDLPPVLAAALAHGAWVAIEPLRRAPGLGRLLASAVLRDRGKSRAHLPCLAEGAKAVPHERRRSRDAATRLIAELEAIAAAAEEGMKQHDRWLLARTLLLRKLDRRRSTSRLPELIEFVLSRPLISAGMIAKELGVTPRAAQNLVAELGLREATGRGRYRAGASCKGVGSRRASSSLSRASLATSGTEASVLSRPNRWRSWSLSDGLAKRLVALCPPTAVSGQLATRAASLARRKPVCSAIRLRLASRAKPVRNP